MTLLKLKYWTNSQGGDRNLDLSLIKELLLPSELLDKKLIASRIEPTLRETRLVSVSSARLLNDLLHDRVDRAFTTVVRYPNGYIWRKRRWSIGSRGRN